MWYPLLLILIASYFCWAVPFRLLSQLHLPLRLLYSAVNLVSRRYQTAQNYASARQGLISLARICLLSLHKDFSAWVGVHIVNLPNKLKFPYFPKFDLEQLLLVEQLALFRNFVHLRLLLLLLFRLPLLRRLDLTVVL